MDFEVMWREMGKVMERCEGGKLARPKSFSLILRTMYDNYFQNVLTKFRRVIHTASYVRQACAWLHPKFELKASPRLVFEKHRQKSAPTNKQINQINDSKWLLRVRDYTVCSRSTTSACRVLGVLYTYSKYRHTNFLAKQNCIVFTMMGFSGVWREAASLS